MKKYIIIFSVLILLAFASACQSNSGKNIVVNSTTEKNTPSNEIITPEKTVNKADEDIITNKPDISADIAEENNEKMINIKIGDNIFTAFLENNSSADALLELLSTGPITIEMRDYGNMEKVGGFGTSLPTNDEHITTEPGDLILYQGNAFVIYYAPNTWSFTKLGKINNITKEELMEALGSGDVTVTLSLPD